MAGKYGMFWMLEVIWGSRECNLESYPFYSRCRVHDCGTPERFRVAYIDEKKKVYKKQKKKFSYSQRQAIN